jgi:hypothetical protein
MIIIKKIYLFSFFFFFNIYSNFISKAWIGLKLLKDLNLRKDSFYYKLLNNRISKAENNRKYPFFSTNTI